MINPYSSDFTANAMLAGKRKDSSNPQTFSGWLRRNWLPLLLPFVAVVVPPMIAILSLQITSAVGVYKGNGSEGEFWSMMILYLSATIAGIVLGLASAAFGARKVGYLCAVIWLLLGSYCLLLTIGFRHG